ncbi:MAG: DNA repair protein RecO [bacterium]|nr:DNA repair protein RecO [bacterium]
MPAFVTDAVVTQTRRYGEADRLVTLFTLERGRLTAIAKSSRKPTSRIRGATETFVVAKFEIAEGRSLDIIRSAEIINPNLGLRDSWTRIQLAGHVAEIANKITDERFPDAEFYELIIEALQKISDGDNTAVIRYKGRILNNMGVFPDLTGCSGCGSGKVRGDVHLDVHGSGFLCADCADESHVFHPVDMDALYILTAVRDGAEPIKSYDKATWDRAEDVLTILLQSFMQQNLKTASAARHARSTENDRENISSTGDDINPVQEKSEPEIQ